VTDNQADRLIDLRGEVCPFTFVKAKLALEEMSTGQTLDVLLDYPPAVENVSRSLSLQGEEILSIAPADDGEWTIRVLKCT
jgi:TusA-related sulfurtransferase